MRLWKILFYSLCLPFLMSISAWSQTDAEGRNFAWQLHQAASQGGNQGQFERMFMQNPQMTKRAFVSTMEYATEIYQQDMNGASQAVAFANQLATLIGQQFGDNTPSSLMQRLMRQDASVMADFASYASSLYPGYAAQGAGYGPGGANPGYQPGYGPGGNPGYGPGGANPGYQPGYGPGGNPGYGPGGANPGYQPGYGPGGNPGYGPGGANPGYQPASSRMCP